MGILFSLIAAFFSSLSQIYVRRGVTKLGVPTGTAIMLVFGTLISLLLALLLEGLQVLWSIKLNSLLFFALAGVIHFIGGWGLQNLSASRIGATRVNAMTSITPLFAVFLAFLTLKQNINGYIILGILLIMIGVYSITMSDS